MPLVPPSRIALQDYRIPARTPICLAQSMEGQMISAIEIARDAGIDPKAFRAKLREEGFAWHEPWERWSVAVGSKEHAAMLAVRDGMRSRPD
jgi:hypothetical protein